MDRRDLLKTSTMLAISSNFGFFPSSFAHQLAPAQNHFYMDTGLGEIYFARNSTSAENAEEIVRSNKILSVGEYIDGFEYTRDHYPVFISNIYRSLPHWVLFGKTDNKEKTHLTLCHFDENQKKWQHIVNFNNSFFECNGVDSLSELLFLENETNENDPLFCLRDRDGSLLFVTYLCKQRQFHLVYKTESPFYLRPTDKVFLPESKVLTQENNILGVMKYGYALTLFQFNYKNSQASFEQIISLQDGEVLKSSDTDEFEIFKLPSLEFTKNSADFSLIVGLFSTQNSRPMILFANQSEGKIFGVSFEKNQEQLWRHRLSVTCTHRFEINDQFRFFPLTDSSAETTHVFLAKEVNQPFQFLEFFPKGTQSFELKQSPLYFPNSPDGLELKDFFDAHKGITTQSIVPLILKTDAKTDARLGSYHFAWVRSDDSGEMMYDLCTLSQDGTIEIKKFTGQAALRSPNNKSLNDRKPQLQGWEDESWVMQKYKSMGCLAGCCFATFCCPCFCVSAVFNCLCVPCRSVAHRTQNSSQLEGDPYAVPERRAVVAPPIPVPAMIAEIPKTNDPVNITAHPVTDHITMLSTLPPQDFFTGKTKWVTNPDSISIRMALDSSFQDDPLFKNTRKLLLYPKEIFGDFWEEIHKNREGMQTLFLEDGSLNTVEIRKMIEKFCSAALWKTESHLQYPSVPIEKEMILAEVKKTFIEILQSRSTHFIQFIAKSMPEGTQLTNLQIANLYEKLIEGLRD